MKFVFTVLSVMACSAMAQLPLLGKGVGHFGVGFNTGRIARKDYNPYNHYGYNGYGNSKGVGNIGIAGIGYGYNPYNKNYGYNGYGYGKGVGNVGSGKAYGNDYNPYSYNSNGYGKGVAGHKAGLGVRGPFVGHGPFIAGHGVYGHGGPFVGHGVAGSFFNKASPYYYH
ncbi:chorion class A protein L11-like [Haliotis asinina]|uniref:chorion class A protein L11-like n=1 Tax=Haliotis asinina TaxID=109174 RepID=UPI003531F1FD